MQNQLSFLMPFADDRLHLRESPQSVRSLIGALVIGYLQNRRDGGSGDGFFLVAQSKYSCGSENYFVFS